MNRVEMNVMTWDKVLMDKRVGQSKFILDKYRRPNGIYSASVSEIYSKAWLRDLIYVILAYLDSNCDRYEKTLHALLDMLREYEWKLDILQYQKPTYKHEHIHIRYSAHDMKEIHSEEWQHHQNDCIGEILWAIGEGVKRGKKVLRDSKDKEIVQKLVWYLNTIEYWNDEDASFWEEGVAKRSSSIGACVAGLISVSEIVYVPSEMIQKGYKSLYELFPRESEDRYVDLALLSLVYPYNIFPKPMSEMLIYNVEKELLRSKGVIRYHTDSYFSTLEKEHGRGLPKEMYIGQEPHWVFGFLFLSMSHMTLGNLEKGRYYIEETEKLMLEDGSLPELYFESDYVDENGNNYNVNCPLLWTQSMFIQAVEMYNKLIKNTNT